MLTIQEIRQLQGKDLMEELSKNIHDLMRMKMDIINGHSKETHQVKILKRYIARLKTIRKESEKKQPLSK